MSLVYIYDEHLSVIKMYDTSRMGEATIDMKINEASTFYTKFEEQLPTNARYIAVQDPIANRRGMVDEFLLYRVHSDQLSDDGMYEYVWTEFAYDELSFDGYITDKRPNNISFRDVLVLVLTGTKWKVGLTNIEGTTSVDFYYESPMDAIKKINEKFPAEFRFWVRLADDGTIVERIVDAVKKRGQNTGRRFETTSNVLSVTAQEDLSNIYSAIVPRGKGEQVSEGGDDGPDGYGRRITIKDVEWSKAKGDPVDKPLGQEWIALEQGETLVDGGLRFKIVVFENDTDINQLALDGYAQLLKDSVPKIQLSGNASDLGVSELGDTVHVVDKSKHIEYEARIFHITYDLLDHTNTKVEFGEDIISSNSISSKIDSITINQKNTRESINWAIQQADGKNTTYHGKDEPSVAVREGDIWFREQDNGTTQMYRYEGGKWVSRDSMSPQRILENFYKNGELDANRINVVNMNASNITSGTINTQLVDFSSAEWNFTLDNHGLTMINKSDTGRKTMIAPEKMTWQYTRSTGEIEPGFEIRMNYGVFGQPGGDNVDFLNIMSRRYIEDNPLGARGDGIALGRYNYGSIDDIDDNHKIGSAYYSAVAVSNDFHGNFNFVGVKLGNFIETGFHMYGQGDNAGTTGHIWSDTIHTFRDTIWRDKTPDVAAIDMKGFVLNTGDWGMQLAVGTNSGIAISGNTVYIVLNGQYYDMKNYIK